MPKKITSLTDEQRNRMQEWAQKFIQIGLRTGPSNRPLFEAGVRECYRFAKLPEPRKIIWVQSPLVAVMAGSLAHHIMSHEAVDGAVGEAVHGAVGEAVDGAVKAHWFRYMGGQFWAGGWYYGPAYVSFFREVCGLELSGDADDRARAYQQTVEHACWWWPHREYVVVSEHPTAIHLESAGGSDRKRLHCQTGMAVEFGDGWGVWSWHGVRVNEQIIMRPDTLTPEQIAKEKNAQVRQVMVERIGIERVCQMFKARCVDRRTVRGAIPFKADENSEIERPYELLMLNIGDGRERPYLKMLNPSVGVWHVEGVHPNCQTVQQALNWRNGLTEGQIDDINGSDWIQQGDVILKPKGKKTYKSQPIQLT